MQKKEEEMRSPESHPEQHYGLLWTFLKWLLVILFIIFVLALLDFSRIMDFVLIIAAIVILFGLIKVEEDKLCTIQIVFIQIVLIIAAIALMLVDKRYIIQLVAIIAGIVFALMMIVKFKWIKDSYLFSWDNVPGTDSERLLRFLRDDIDIGWAENAEILKSDDGKTIRIFKDENSAEIIINETEGKATLKISDGRTHDLKVKKENCKLNIYQYSMECEKETLRDLDAWEAYKHADNLYHQRFNFFLVAESMLIVSFATTFSSGSLNTNSVRIAITILGMIFTFSWFYVNNRIGWRLNYLNENYLKRCSQTYGDYLNRVKGIPSAFFMTYLLPAATFVFWCYLLYITVKLV